jgi:hypothetical protein
MSLCRDALKEVLQMVEDDTIRIRPSDRKKFLEKLEQWGDAVDTEKDAFEFTSEAVNLKNSNDIGVWTDGCGFFSESSEEFLPCAYKLKSGEWYKVSILKVSKEKV